MTSAAAARPPTSGAGEHVVPLGAVGRDDVVTAGGKGANLGELVRAGFPVPDGFVVRTEAYAGAYNAMVEAGAIGPDGAALRAAFASADLPEPLRAAVLAAYARLGGGPVAVRSSATAEDLPGATFAGQQDTYLDVDGDEAVLDAVRRCWGSLWTDRAIAYRSRRDVDSATARIAVVVQRMVPAEFAGVLFTANPLTGDRAQVVIEASSGLGEAVVSGLVTPDRYVVDAGGEMRERSGAGRLPDPVVRELTQLGRAVAAHFGAPQDVEWAYAGGRLWLVQARPMTALPPPPIRLNRIQRLTGPQILEMLPVRPYPMDMSTWLLAGAGRMVGRMLGEIAGLRIDFADVLPESGGVVDRYVPPLPRPTLKMLTAPVRALRLIRRYRTANWTQDPRFGEFERTVDRLAALDVTTMDWADLRALPRRALAALEPITDLRVDYLPRTGFDLLRLRALLLVLGRTKLFPLLVTGARTRTEDANRAMTALAEQVRADPRLRAAFTLLEPDALAERIAQDDALAGFRGAFEAFLAEYGHRETASPLLMSTPTWGAARATVLSMIGVLAEEPRLPADAGRADDAVRRLMAHPLVRLTRTGPAVQRVVAAARDGIAFREDTHFHGTRGLPVLRRAVLEMGRRLAAAGVLRETDEVLHLRIEELPGEDPARLPAADAQRLRTHVRERSARRAELAGVPLITAAVLYPGRAAAGESGVLATGTPASGGRATGPARIVHSPAEFGSLHSGDVLVCRYTNPAWTPLFQRAAAVVADTGGLASHAAIVAREYGIPAVMATGTGTAVLTDGQVVTVDGDTGKVTAPVAGKPLSRNDVA